VASRFPWHEEVEEAEEPTVAPFKIVGPLKMAVLAVLAVLTVRRPCEENDP
jgi:hypothetical protein